MIPGCCSKRGCPGEPGGDQLAERDGGGGDGLRRLLAARHHRGQPDAKHQVNMDMVVFMPMF